MQQVEMGELVMTTFGKARKVGWNHDQEGLYVYIKKDFTEEEWRGVSPSNGPCVYKLLPDAAVEPLQPDTGLVGRIIKSKSGKEYKVLSVRGNQVKVKSVVTGLGWYTTMASVEKNFIK
jgi:hypothetical protein